MCRGQRRKLEQLGRGEAQRLARPENLGKRLSLKLLPFDRAMLASNPV
jgi:hypothetical protein